MGGAERDQMRQSRVADRGSHLHGDLRTQIRDEKQLAEDREGSKQSWRVHVLELSPPGLVLRGQLATVWLNPKLRSTGVSFSPQELRGRRSTHPAVLESRPYPGVLPTTLQALPSRSLSWLACSEALTGSLLL